MSDMDLLEMACDCHARSKQYGTDLIEYITVQQDLRFHFDREHFRKLKAYCTALVEMTKDDDYSQLLNPDTVLCFDDGDTEAHRYRASGIPGARQRIDIFGNQYLF